jgi:hypothetical protein
MAGGEHSHLEKGEMKNAEGKKLKERCLGLVFVHLGSRLHRGPIKPLGCAFG